MFINLAASVPAGIFSTTGMLGFEIAEGLREEHTHQLRLGRRCIPVLQRCAGRWLKCRDCGV